MLDQCYWGQCWSNVVDENIPGVKLQKTVIKLFKIFFPVFPKSADVLFAAQWREYKKGSSSFLEVVSQFAQNVPRTFWEHSSYMFYNGFLGVFI